MATAPPAFAGSPSLSVKSTTWDQVGLDSNRPQSSAVTTFPVGARVCNASSDASAAMFKSSLLLTPKDRLPAEVKAELCRLAPTRIVVLGGTAAVSAGVQSALAACLASRP